LKPSRPPELATWLLEHLTRREHREALAGDILEKYREGRADRWYWKQVLVAIAADFSTEFRSRWVSAVFALVVCGTFPWKQLFLHAKFESFLFSGIQLSWPASFLVGVAIISGFEGVILLLALGVYVVSTNSVHPRRFLIGFGSALLVLALGNTAVTISQVLPWPRLFFYYVVWRLPLFFSLLLAMRVAGAKTMQTSASRIST
jgi:hypothetical protein